VISIYKVGDRVRIVPRWKSDFAVVPEMDRFLGTVQTINYVNFIGGYYHVEGNNFFWYPHMIAGFASQSVSLKGSQFLLCSRLDPAPIKPGQTRLELKGE